MSRMLLPVLFVTLALATPASTQGDPLEELKKEVAGLKETVARQAAQLAALQKQADEGKKEASNLVKALDEAEKGGFTLPAPNTDARQALLSGLQRYARVASGGKAEPEPDKE